MDWLFIATSICIALAIWSMNQSLAASLNPDISHTFLIDILKKCQSASYFSNFIFTFVCNHVEFCFHNLYILMISKTQMFFLSSTTLNANACLRNLWYHSLFFLMGHFLFQNQQEMTKDA